MKRFGLLAVALLVGCGETMGPRPVDRGPGTPSFTVAASGPITLDQTTGNLGETTTISQDFRPTNPHVGDARTFNIGVF